MERNGLLLEEKEFSRISPDDVAIAQFYQKYGSSVLIIRHGTAVARCADELADQVGAPICREALYAAGQLHDMVRYLPDHAAACAKILTESGYPDVGAIVATHHDLPEEAGIENCLLYLADKLVQEDQRVSLQWRFEQARRKCRTAQAVAAWEKRYQRACRIVETLHLNLK